MKILTLDIETSPNVADIWGMFNQNVSLSQLRETSRVISFASKWLDNPEVEFYSEFHDGSEEMVKQAHRLLDETDAVIHFNGTSFDIKNLQKMFVLGGMNPPSPFQQIDLLRVVKKKFRFTSNKLDHVASQLGLGNKESHSGHTLWVQCMAGDIRAWDKMRTYNKQDVVLTEELYKKLLPWIDNHPNINLYNGTEDGCPVCGGSNLQKRGFAYTSISKFQRFLCTDCGRWSKSGTAEGRTDLRNTA